MVGSMLVGDPDCAVADIDCSLAIVAGSELSRAVPLPAIVTTSANVVASLPIPVDSVVEYSSSVSLPASLDVSWLVANKVATVVDESEVDAVGSWVVVVVVGDEVLSVVSGKVVITADVSVVVVTTIGYKKGLLLET